MARWRVPATREEVADVLGDPLDLPRWWPSVWLDVELLDPGRRDGVGRAVTILSKGWLPYTIRWRLTTTRAAGPDGFAIRAEGDFVGTGAWVFKQDGDHVVMLYDWRIAAEKPLLRRLTWLLRPAFSANHRWAMRQGELSLLRELDRRRLGPDAPFPVPPPGPTFAWLLRRGAQADAK